MVQIGKTNKLTIKKSVDFGVYLDGGDDQEILLPKRYVPESAKPGDEISVFIYHDNEGRIIATTDKPYAEVGEFQFMQVNQVTQIGAFMNWGIMKDLLVPYREQRTSMREGRWYLVYVRIDDVTGRIMASARINKFINNVPPEYETNEEVSLLVIDETEIGYKVIINNKHGGMLYKNEVFQRLEKGEHLKGFIKEIREDDKIDVSLKPLGFKKIEGISAIILQSLKAGGGFLNVHDKSNPDLIYSLFRCSKKSFKQAIGTLYKNHLIQIEPNGIRLTELGSKQL